MPAMAELLWQFFAGRKDTYTVQQPDGSYVRAAAELTPEVLQKHVRGEITIGAYLVVPATNRVQIGVLDLDSKAPPCRERVLWLKHWLEHFGLKPLIEPSGNKGYHLWLVFKAWLLASDVQRLLKAAIRAAEEALGKPDYLVEIFPKQVSVSEKNFGSAIKLPWGLHCKTGRRTVFIEEDFQPLPDWGAATVEALPAVSEADLQAILLEFPAEPTPQKKTEKPSLPHTPELDELAVQKLLESCKFMEHCQEHAASLKEPEWWVMVHLLAPLGEPGAKKIHELSAPYPQYSEKETDQKVAQAKKALERGVGPHTCVVVRENLGFHCPKECLDYIATLEVLSPTGLALKLAAQQLILERTSSVTITTSKRGKQETKVNMPRLAEEIMGVRCFKTFRETEEVLVYDKGVYKPLGETVVKEEVQWRLLDLTTTHRVNEVVDYVRRATYTNRELFNKAGHILNVENGLLDTTTMELKPHSPAFLSTIRIPTIYDPQGTCPRVRQFLTEVLIPKDLAVAEEIFGYCLEPSYFIHKAFLLLGDGANGKSVFIELLRSFLGPDNCATVSLQAFDNNRFAASLLWGKLANLYADLPSTAMRHLGRFKMLTGQDTLDAEEKFKRGFGFTNKAKLVFSANKPPKIQGEDSFAFWRRWILINFPNQFIGEKADKRLLEKLTQERVGLLNLALTGLQRIRKQHEFSYGTQAEEVAELYIQAADPIHAFISTACGLNPSMWVTKDELYLVYKKFCQHRGLPILGKESFGRAIKNSTFAAEIKSGRRRVDGELTYVWQGIFIYIEEGEESEEETGEELDLKF